MERTVLGEAEEARQTYRCEAVVVDERSGAEV